MHNTPSRMRASNTSVATTGDASLVISMDESTRLPFMSDAPVGLDAKLAQAHLTDCEWC
jgi:hypothetical protein